MTIPTELQVALVGLLTSVLTAVAVRLKRKVDQSYRRQGETALIDAAWVYRHLNDCASFLRTDRTLVLYTSNGGGIPSAGKSLFLTVLYEIVRGDGLNPITNRFQGLQVDGSYLAFISQVADPNRGVWQGKPSELEPGLLRSLYESEGVTFAYISRIASTAERFYYLSLHWHDTTPPSQSTIDLAVRTATSELRPLLTGEPRH